MVSTAIMCMYIQLYQTIWWSTIMGTIINREWKHTPHPKLFAKRCVATIAFGWVNATNGAIIIIKHIIVLSEHRHDMYSNSKLANRQLMVIVQNPGSAKSYYMAFTSPVLWKIKPLKIYQGCTCIVYFLSCDLRREAIRPYTSVPV